MHELAKERGVQIRRSKERGCLKKGKGESKDILGMREKWWSKSLAAPRSGVLSLMSPGSGLGKGFGGL